MVDNHTLVQGGLDTSHDWIVQHTGIERRHVAAPEEATSDLGIRAAERALEVASIHPAELGYIVCATSTPDHLLPSTANLIQTGIGARCGALDINAGCSGFVQALVVGEALLAKVQRPVLVVAADTYSRLVDPKDRTTAIFFGDGGSAAILAPSEDGSLTAISGSDGSGAPHLIVRDGGSRAPLDHGRVGDYKNRLFMDGRRVWDFVLSTVPDLVRDTVSEAGFSIDDIDWLIPHQANSKLLGVIAAELGIPSSKVINLVKDHANTAAASVGIALDHALRTQAVRRGDLLVLVGFGAGLSWSAACFRY